ncbi:MAG: hypothetical protein LUE17_04345 [Planctomycetaceae bacterium]|nr:hypothetical protein [Planctomycetaceae bacterium]
MDDDLPLIWIIDSDRNPLAEHLDAFSGWARARHLPHGAAADWTMPPDAIYASAELAGGPQGEVFADLLAAAGAIPVLVVARLRSLAQAVAYFRAGAADYLSLPLEEEEARDRYVAAMERAETLAMQGMVVELEPVDQEVGEISLSLRPSLPEPIPDEEDILAHLHAEPRESVRAEPSGKPETAETDAAADESAIVETVVEKATITDAAVEDPAEDEPVAVDGLPIPTLWEELPCGLLVFDSSVNLVFSNSLGLEMFGHTSLAELQEVLESHRDSFAAHGSNHRPLPDNQWPHLVAAKTRTARSAVVSIEKPDRRRAWLRVDCLPHVADGALSRLSMTLVNLTGELPPLQVQAESDSAPARKEKAKKRGKRKK